MASRCGFCNALRLILFCALVGIAAAWLARVGGVGARGQMVATFLGAFVPLLMAARRRRIAPPRD